MPPMPSMPSMPPTSVHHGSGNRQPPTAPLVPSWIPAKTATSGIMSHRPISRQIPCWRPCQLRETSISGKNGNASPGCAGGYIRASGLAASFRARTAALTIRQTSSSGKNGNVRQRPSSTIFAVNSAFATAPAPQNLDFRQKRQCHSPVSCAAVPSPKRTRVATLYAKADNMAISNASQCPHPVVATRSVGAHCVRPSGACPACSLACCAASHIRLR